MAWEPTRPIPWRRLLRDWILYGTIMSVVFTAFYRDRLSAGPFVGLLFSGPLFIGIGAVLAKFGYQRKTLKDLRAETAVREQAKDAAKQSAVSTSSGRPRPAPTSRTSTGPNQRPKNQRPKSHRTGRGGR